MTFGGKSIFPLVFFIIGLAGCNQAPLRPLIYIFLLENVPLERMDCSNANPLPNPAEILCDEFVRFSNLGPLSTSIESDIASLFTGKPPIQHGLIDPSVHSLKAEETSWLETASLRGIRSLFLIGGPPFTRKSGLQQGFSVFDDQYPFQLDQFHRDVASALQTATQFSLDNEAEGVIVLTQISDLLFSELKTSKNFDVKNETMDQVLTKLETFFFGLKKRKRWRYSQVLVIALPPVQENRKTNPAFATLFWKPSHLRKDIHTSFQRDNPISFEDVGIFFQSYVKLPMTSLDEHELPLGTVAKPIPILQQPQASIPSNQDQDPRIKSDFQSDFENEIGQLAMDFIEKKQWNELLRLGRKQRKPKWVDVAALNLNNQKNSLYQTSKTQMNTHQMARSKEPEDERLRVLRLTWMDKGPASPMTQKLILFEQIDRKLWRKNKTLGAPWKNLKYPPSAAPTDSELFLVTPK